MARTPKLKKSEAPASPELTAIPQSKILRVTVMTAHDGTCCHSTCSWFEYVGQGVAMCDLFKDQVLEDANKVTAKRCAKCLALYV